MTVAEKVTTENIFSLLYSLIFSNNLLEEHIYIYRNRNRIYICMYIFLSIYIDTTFHEVLYTDISVYVFALYKYTSYI